MMQGKRRGKKGPSPALDLNLAEAVDGVHVTDVTTYLQGYRKSLGGILAPAPFL